MHAFRFPLLLALLALGTAAAPGAGASGSFDGGLIVSQNAGASQIGAEVMQDGGNAIDAAVAVAFALAVVHPTAGNIGGGGFLLWRPAVGEPTAYDFRETAPADAHPHMWLDGGKYDPGCHHESHLAVGVPGTVAGLHLAWRDHGALPWRRLVEPAIGLAREGFVVTEGLAASLMRVMPRLERHPASLDQFTRDGEHLQAGDLLIQADLAESLMRIAARGPDGFYRGRTAELIVQEMERGGGLITLEDLAGYRAKRRTPLRGSYRGHEILSMPPPSSGGVVLLAMLNILEGYGLGALGAGEPASLHLMAEAMRRAYADRARHLGDPDFNPDLPLDMLTSKSHAEALRATIDPKRASASEPERFFWHEAPQESPETTHFSVVDPGGNAVALTYTLEMGYGSGIVVPGAGFLLNNEMGDFNAAPGLTDTLGRIGTLPNLAEPGKRPLSSMTPTIVARDGRLVMVTGSLGGRTIINTVMQTILNVIDHGMTAQAAVDAGRIHHQWLPDRIQFEKDRLSAEALTELRSLGHELFEVPYQGVAAVIVVDPERGALQAGIDGRAPDGGAAGY
jgi:gamma-glutamyltranspeptidase / glutathione hydrolase